MSIKNCANVMRYKQEVDCELILHLVSILYQYGSLRRQGVSVNNMNTSPQTLTKRIVEGKDN